MSCSEERRGYYFSFDYRAYREWTAKAVIRIDDDEPDLYTFAPGSRTAGDNKAAAKKRCF